MTEVRMREILPSGPEEEKSGIVYLVGAGPGDPGLMTVRGSELLARADVVVYDRLVSEELLLLARPDAKLVNVGKIPGSTEVSQAQINAVLVEEARKGNMVVRLKGGDPFVFGRGAEEAAYLREHKIPFAVVPGVTAAVAVPAYAGIPVTDRRCASSFAVISGHRAGDGQDKGNGTPAQSALLDEWSARAWAADTLVILMGMSDLDSIVQGLLRGGRPPQTPTAVIQWGTTSRQRVVVGALADIKDRADRAGLSAPAVVVVGEVVGLRETLACHESKETGSSDGSIEPGARDS